MIFASSLLYLPQLITQLQGNETGNVQQFFENYVIDQSSRSTSLYFGLIVFFTYFYVSITFNPEERADDMKRYGGFIPGIRPGRPTAEYLQYVLSRITLPGSIYLGRWPSCRTCSCRSRSRGRTRTSRSVARCSSWSEWGWRR